MTSTYYCRTTIHYLCMRETVKVQMDSPWSNVRCWRRYTIYQGKDRSLKAKRPDSRVLTFNQNMTPRKTSGSDDEPETWYIVYWEMRKHGRANQSILLEKEALSLLLSCIIIMECWMHQRRLSDDLDRCEHNIIG